MKKKNQCLPKRKTNSEGKWKNVFTRFKENSINNGTIKKGNKIFVPLNSKYAGNIPNKSSTQNCLKNSSNYIVIKKLLGKAK